MKYVVIDWSDDAYTIRGGPYVVATFEVDAITGFCYDGGRLDIDGVEDTLYIGTHQFSVRKETDRDIDEEAR